MWELWGVEILAFPLTYHIAYTTACCYCTSRDLQQKTLSMTDYSDALESFYVLDFTYVRHASRGQKVTGYSIQALPLLRKHN